MKDFTSLTKQIIINGIDNKIYDFYYLLVNSPSYQSMISRAREIISEVNKIESSLEFENYAIGKVKELKKYKHYTILINDIENAFMKKISHAFDYEGN